MRVPEPHMECADPFPFFALRATKGKLRWVGGSVVGLGHAERRAEAWADAECCGLEVRAPGRFDLRR
ncbi:MAG: hypothetical protein B7Z37_24935 [Verrucomicrobia bacterium 12-59-8]|nr:MAG: hypothetical protein B7Z37_24935 [Verrucomicrobia bacterium 12-59-8]